MQEGDKVSIGWALTADDNYTGGGKEKNYRSPPTARSGFNVSSATNDEHKHHIIFILFRCSLETRRSAAASLFKSNALS